MASEVQRWDPQLPIVCKVVKTTKRAHLLHKGRVVAKAVVVNVRDRERLRSLSVPESEKTPKSTLEEGETGLTSTQALSESAEAKEDVTKLIGVDLSEANTGQLGSAQTAVSFAERLQWRVSFRGGS